MKITITSFMTAVDEKDPKPGNKRMYSVVVEKDGGAANYPLDNWQVSGFISELIWKQSIEDLNAKTNRHQGQD